MALAIIIVYYIRIAEIKVFLLMSCKGLPRLTLNHRIFMIPYIPQISHKYLPEKPLH